MSIEERKSASGIKYRAKYREAYATFTRKTDAKNWEAHQKVENELSKYLPSKVEECTITELFNRWMQKHAEINKAPTSIKRDKQIFRDYIGPAIGKYKCHQVTGSQVESIVTTLKREGRLSDKSINNVIILLKTILNYGVKRLHLLRSPAIGTSKLKCHEQDFNYWEKEDAQKFLDFAKQKYITDKTVYVFYLTALRTGMRLGEIIALKWDCVDLERCIITVARTYDGALKTIKNTTKGRRTRHVGISEVLLPELKELKQKNPKSEFVFSNQEGSFLDPSNLRHRKFERDVLQAGVKKVRIHDMRHTFASHYVTNRGDIYALKMLLGHQDIKTTTRYAHLAPDHVAKTVDIVNYGLNIPKERNLRLVVNNTLDVKVPKFDPEAIKKAFIISDKSL